MTLDLFAKALNLQQPRLVFLCGDDELGRGKAAERLVDLFHVFLHEGMMVAERQWCHILCIAL